MSFRGCSNSKLFSSSLKTRLHHRLRIALARAVQWKDLELWEEMHLDSTEELLGEILAQTSVADTNGGRGVDSASATSPEGLALAKGYTARLCKGFSKRHKAHSYKPQCENGSQEASVTV